MIEIEKLILHPIQLNNVELIKCNLIKNQNITEKISLDNMRVNLKSWGEVINSSNEGYTYLNVLIDFDDDIKPFHIDILYRGFCLINGTNWTSEQYKHFLEAQGVKLLWPYIKPAVADFMIKMDIAPLKLPTLDVLKTMENSKKTEE